MRNNNLELVTIVKYKWKCTVTDKINKVEENFNIDEIYGNIFDFMKCDLVITNGNTVIYYSRKNNELRIYRKRTSKKNLCYINKDFIDKFNKLGLLLQMMKLTKLTNYQ